MIYATRPIDTEADIILVAKSWLAGVYSLDELIAALSNGNCALGCARVSRILEELGILDHGFTYAPNARWTMEGAYWPAIFLVVYAMNNDLGGGIALMSPAAAAAIFVGVLVDAIIKGRARARIRQALLQLGEPQPLTCQPTGNISPPGSSMRTNPIPVPQSDQSSTASAQMHDNSRIKRTVSYVNLNQLPHMSHATAHMRSNLGHVRSRSLTSNASPSPGISIIGPATQQAEKPN